MEKAGREHSAAGNAPGRSRTRAWEKAASARVAVNGCGMEPDPGNLAPRFPSSVSRTLTLAGKYRPPSKRTIGSSSRNDLRDKESWQ